MYTYVVAVRILHALEDVSIDFPNEGSLLIRKNVFNSLNGEEAKHQIMEDTSLGQKDLPFGPHDIHTSEGKAAERVPPWYLLGLFSESEFHTRTTSE